MDLRSGTIFPKVPQKPPKATTRSLYRPKSAKIAPIMAENDAIPGKAPKPAYIPPNIPKGLLSPYNPTETEPLVYSLEEKSGFFAPEKCVEMGATKADAKTYTIIMPPPNANGRLHAGHALGTALQDIFTRFQRMRGKRTLWVPGADHAGFETQIVYERQLEKEGRSRFDIPRDQLYKEIYDFTIENKKYMEDDVRRLGASCDWARERFTLDPEVVSAAQDTFRKMYADDLVYRGNRIVNWCAKHQTSLSDVETEFKEQKDNLYYLQYGPFVIATARPETKFGDKYVVMHPDDKRYAEYKDGQKIDLEWINGPVTATVVKDDVIDMEFGTGVMTITPWHDSIDFDIAARHNLPFEQIIDFKGKLLPVAGEFAGLHISKARSLIVEKMKSKGLLVKTDEAYVHNVKCCYKCNTQIEPQIKDQWFVKMKPLAEKALKAVKEGKTEFIPDNYEKIFNYWMENTLDWNISRQIVWGIPIPAKICTACNQGYLDTDTATTCAKCGGELVQDTDTFDTWFSSGQWPLLALGYKGSKVTDAEQPDVVTYHPTQLMETGRDLVFKWVPRMIIFSLYLRGEVPFDKVYFHGLVNDAKGKKMSKSVGNVISPITLIDKYGADALRMGLIVGNTPGSDLALIEDKIKGYKHFANKIWNVARFILTSASTAGASDAQGTGTKVEFDAHFSAWTDADKILNEERMAEIKSITDELEGYKVHLAAEKAYHYIWSRLADVILEESKPIFNGGTAEEKMSRAQFLLHTLRDIVKIMHPFMPFVTEELWSIITTEKGLAEKADILKAEELLLIQSWPL